MPRLLLLLFLGCALCSPLRPALAAAPAPSPEELLQRGERLYRQGLLADGTPLRAVVQGDIEVEGTMFSCESCHLRSGLGSVEGGVISPPVTGAVLFRPQIQASEENIPDWETIPAIFDQGLRRPAYDDRTLALAIWNGLSPSGREFNPTMPRYLLDPDDMDALVTYLNQLSATPPPGIDATTLQLATVVSTDLPAEQREAMLSVLQAYAAMRSGESRLESKRARVGAFFDRKMYSGYRRLQLHVWELHGSRETWPAQLAEHYRRTPVFALLGGMVSGSWAPVHEFCEARQLPCLFPQTELPVIGDDWYTLYFSKGHYQQGEAVARHLRSELQGAAPPPLLQLVRDEPAARAVAAGFDATWQRLGFAPPTTRLLPVGQPLAETLRTLPNWRNTTLLLWLGSDCYPDLQRWAADGRPLPNIYLAASLLGDTWRTLPPAARTNVLLAWPRRLPSEPARVGEVVRIWLKTRNLPQLDQTIQTNMYYAVSQLGNALMMLEDDFYRDYLLDVIDMSNDQTHNILTWPRLSFGQGQRYAAKGCYIVRIGPGDTPALQPLTDWVVH